MFCDVVAVVVVFVALALNAHTHTHTRRADLRRGESHQRSEETIKLAVKQTKRNGKFVSEATVYCVCLCLCGCMPRVQIHEDERNERKKCTRKRPLFVHSRDNKMCNKNNHEHGDECESESEKEMGKEVNNKQHRFWLKLFYDLVRVHFWRILFEFFLRIHCWPCVRVCVCVGSGTVSFFFYLHNVRVFTTQTQTTCGN